MSEEKVPTERVLETRSEKKARWISILIIYFTVFLMNLGFTIVLTGVWPYMLKLDKESTKEYMGYVVAANPLAQMLFSPLFGWWSNKLGGSVRIPLLTSVAIFTIASAGYSVLEIIPNNTRHWMLASRFIVGLSSANMAICRSYLSSATTLEERTRGIAYISLAQVLGFIFGPCLQALVTPLGGEGYSIPIGNGKLTIDMYTACSWISTIMGLINFVLLLPCFFKERFIAAKEAMAISGAATEKAAWKLMKPDYLSAWTLIFAFFAISTIFVLLETLGTSLTMEEFAWTRQEALYYMGILLSVGGVISGVTFLLLSPFCKWFGEINVMIWGGFLFMVISGFCLIPWGTDPPLLAQNENEVGCPVDQAWCHYTPRMTVTQFLIGYAFVALGYPVGITLIQTVFSKTLGPRPQGVWMGLMTGGGCLSRVMGPVGVSYIYARLGPVWLFSSTTTLMILTIAWLLIFSRRIRAACTIVPNSPADQPLTAMSQA